MGARRAAMERSRACEHPPVRRRGGSARGSSLTAWLAAHLQLVVELHRREQRGLDRRRGRAHQRRTRRSCSNRKPIPSRWPSAAAERAALRRGRAALLCAKSGRARHVRPVDAHSPTAETSVGKFRGNFHRKHPAEPSTAETSAGNFRRAGWRTDCGGQARPRAALERQQRVPLGVGRHARLARARRRCAGASNDGLRCARNGAYYSTMSRS